MADVGSFMKDAFKYRGNQVRVVGSATEPWFNAKDICNILEYANATEALNKNVAKEDRMNLKNLYSLIMRSKMKSAVAFQSWVTKDVLPSIRKKGYYIKPDLDEKETEQLREELAAREKQLSEARAELKKKDAQLNIVHQVNKDLLESKKFNEKKDKIYIGSTAAYARQGLWKVSRTKSLGPRTAGNNTSHPVGDEFIIFKVIDTWDGVHLENRLHKLLNPFRPVRAREFFLLPWDLLMEVIDLINVNYSAEIDAVNRLLEDFLKLQSTSPLQPAEYIGSLELDSFLPQAPSPISESKENIPNEAGMESTKDTPVHRRTTFNAKDLTDDQIVEGVRCCLAQYRTRYPNAHISWSHLKDILRAHFNVPKYKFKALWWKPKVENIVSLIA
jgi:prophage antirepressor-like protein